MTGSVTKHFTFNEFIVTETGINNTPPNELLKNMYRIADLLECVRMWCGNLPVYVKSCYRSPDVNHAVGGAVTDALYQTTITAGVGVDVAGGGAGNTSIYNYEIIKVT